MPTRRGRFILLSVATILAASLWWAVSVEREKRHIAQEYAKAQEMVKQLADERTHLTNEVTQAQQTIEGQTVDLTNYHRQLQEAQGQLDKTVGELAALQREHEQLREHDTSLVTQLNSVMTEKQQLEAKLSSLRELKLAIRDVRRKMWDQHWAAWRARIETLKAADQERLASGNRGFVVRGGTSTLGSATKLQVHVLEPQVQ